MSMYMGLPIKTNQRNRYAAFGDIYPFLKYPIVFSKKGYQKAKKTINTRLK